MLAELSRVQVGDIEASVLALTGRYGGFKWTPEPLPPREQWIDKEEYDYEVTRQTDYKYEQGEVRLGLLLPVLAAWLGPWALQERSLPCVSAVLWVA